jgi:phage gp36-like protein
MYCSVEDIARNMDNTKLKELTTDSSYQNQYDEELINVNIEEQSVYMDAYLSGRYLLPITNTSDLKILKLICTHLVIDAIYSRRLSEIPESIYLKKKNAIADLEKIQKGTIVLFSASESEQSQERVSGRRTSKITKYFTNDALRGF